MAKLREEDRDLWCNSNGSEIKKTEPSELLICLLGLCYGAISSQYNYPLKWYNHEHGVVFILFKCNFYLPFLKISLLFLRILQSAFIKSRILVYVRKSIWDGQLLIRMNTNIFIFQPVIVWNRLRDIHDFITTNDFSFITNLTPNPSYKYIPIESFNSKSVFYIQM